MITMKTKNLKENKMTILTKKYLLEAVDEVAELSDEMVTSVLSDLVENLCDDSFGCTKVAKFLLKKQNELTEEFEGEYKFDFPITNEMVGE